MVTANSMIRQSMSEFVQEICNCDVTKVYEQNMYILEIIKGSKKGIDKLNLHDEQA